MTSIFKTTILLGALTGLLMLIGGMVGGRHGVEVAFIFAAPFVIAGFRSSSEHYGAFCVKTVAYLLMLQGWIPNLWHY